MLMGYFTILTEQASQITSGKENSTRSGLAGNAGFFPHVLIGFGDLKLGTHAAIAVCSHYSVCVTVSGAKGAVLIIFSGIKIIHIV